MPFIPVFLIFRFFFKFNWHALQLATLVILHAHTVACTEFWQHSSQPALLSSLSSHKTAHHLVLSQRISGPIRPVPTLFSPPTSTSVYTFYEKEASGASLVHTGQYRIVLLQMWCQFLLLQFFLVFLVDHLHYSYLIIFICVDLILSVTFYLHDTSSSTNQTKTDLFHCCYDCHRCCCYI